jgi:carboxyl-terminal processing protease
MKLSLHGVLSHSRLKFLICCLILIFSATAQTIKAQTGIDESKNSSPSFNRARGLRMIRDIKEALRSKYYDPKFHGIDLDERFKKAAEKIKTLNANWEIFREIADILLEFNDSHTRFFPPYRTVYVEYGFTMQMIGNDCYIVDVKKGSNAELKQLGAGDKVLKIGNYQPTRANLWMLEYFLYALDPQSVLPMTIQSLDGKQRAIQVESKVISFEERKKQQDKRKAERKETAYKCVEINSDSIACKLYTFSVEKDVISRMMKDVGTHKNLILDLRGNPGGYVKTESYLTGYFFDRDIKIGEEKRREKIREQMAKSLKEKAFLGNLVVLIDSESASASEAFARTIQIQKRGKVVGDQSAGAVMTSISLDMADFRDAPGLGYGEREKLDSIYSISLTIGDFIMSDGSRLEGLGVIPDYPIGPSGYAISQKSDPVLARAAALFDVKITPEEAGKFQFLVAKIEDDDPQTDAGEAENK